MDPGRGALPLTFLSPLEALVGGRGHVPATRQVLGLNRPHPGAALPSGNSFLPASHHLLSSASPPPLCCPSCQLLPGRGHALTLLGFR